MSISYVFLEFPVFIIKLEAAISETYGNKVTDSFSERNPIMINRIGVKI